MHRVRALMMMMLAALWVPASGASWAYCQRSGVVHPAGGDCCEDDADSCCDGCCGEQDGGQSAPDCCIDAGKMMPEALPPVTRDVVPATPLLPGSVELAGATPEILPGEVSFRTWLSGWPPGRAVFLVHGSWRL